MVVVSFQHHFLKIIQIVPQTKLPLQVRILMNNDEPQEIRRQRIDEWENLDENGYRYHKSQWDTPKQSTIAFENFVSKNISKSTQIIDMGAGAGASTAYLASKHRSVHFTCFDYSNELTALGRKIAQDKRITNLTFNQGDWFNLNQTNQFDGCISLQTLSWLPDYEAALLEIFKKINPTWIGLTSLFYEGDITCRIEVEEHEKNKKSFYNVYSLPAISRLCEREGYVLVKSSPFVIDIDLAKPKNLNVMGTYTREVVTNNADTVERIQISGPLLMNWYMLLIEKIS